MRRPSLIAAAALAVAGASFQAQRVPAAAPPPQPPPPSMEFTALLFLFPWAGAVVETFDPIDVNAFDVLFDTVEDPDAFDNPPHR